MAAPALHTLTKRFIQQTGATSCRLLRSSSHARFIEVSASCLVAKYETLMPNSKIYSTASRRFQSCSAATWLCEPFSRLRRFGNVHSQTWAFVIEIFGFPGFVLRQEAHICSKICHGNPKAKFVDGQWMGISGSFRG